MDYRSIPLGVLREAAGEAITVSSLRALADTLGIGRTTLHNFIQGETHPHPRVRRRLAEWYISQTQPAKPGSVEEFDAALKLLLRDLKPQHGPTAQSAVLALLYTLYLLTESPIPAALEALRGHSGETEENESRESLSASGDPAGARPPSTLTRT